MTGLFSAEQQEGYGGNFQTQLSQLPEDQQGSFRVVQVTFSSDIPLSTSEFNHLVSIEPNSFIAKKHVDRACRFLRMKRRFSAIAVDMSDVVGGKKLHFTLQAHWVLKKLELSGIWFGKPRYAALYQQQLGDAFDINLHEESIKAFEKYLHDKGFFRCSVTDELVYEKRHKTITAKIKIKKHHRFRLEDVAIEVETKDGQEPAALASVLSTLREQTHSALVHTYYAKRVVKKYAGKIKKAMQREGFTNVRIQLKRALDPVKPKLALTYRVQLGLRKKITFEGNTVFSHDYLKNEFIERQMPDWLLAPDIIAQHLLYEYYKKGYWHTHVKHKSDGLDAYHFVITEGKPIIINRVSIIDAVTKMPERATQLLVEMLKGKQCDQSLLDQSLDRLKAFYVGNGYWDFAIIDKRFVKQKKTGLYAVTIMINKGVQRMWSGFSIEGFKHLEASEFFQKHKRGSRLEQIPFNFQWLSDQRAFLMRYFQHLGYWYVDVQPSLVPMPADDKTGSGRQYFFVEWKVAQGPQVKFGKPVLRGSTTVPFERIEKQLQFKEGQLWNRDAIDRTRKRLKSLDVFQAVQVQPYQLSKRKEKKPVMITLVDDDPVELRARLGYFVTSKNFLFKQQETIRAGGSFIVKNPTNRADRVAFDADWTRYERKLILDYKQPSPFGLPALGQLKVLANKYIHPVKIAQSDSAYEAYEQGFLFGLNDEYKEHYYWGVILGNEWLRISRVRGNLKFDPYLIDKTLPYLILEPKFEIDSRDNKVNPKKGLFTAASFKMMFPENHGEGMAKLNLEQSAFYEFHPSVVLAARVRLGHIFGHKFDRILPVERFYLGGPFSVRGYEPDTIPPLGISYRVVDGKVIKDYTVQGGNSLALGNLEVRFPLYGSLGAVLFQDIGILSQTGLFGLKHRWYPGSGFGLRYKTPIGAIRFDVGWRWKRRMEGDTKNLSWYLTLGEAF